jgi:hypothetical protein
VLQQNLDIYSFRQERVLALPEGFQQPHFVGLKLTDTKDRHFRFRGGSDP